jgi:hypothetical protein
MLGKIRSKNVNILHSIPKHEILNMKNLNFVTQLRQKRIEDEKYKELFSLDLRRKKRILNHSLSNKKNI